MRKITDVDDNENKTKLNDEGWCPPVVYIEQRWFNEWMMNWEKKTDRKKNEHTLQNRS